MYLKKIVASGFKSFADKIEIDLTNGITGIVGPNGSGKSNVVDAVRWVLGEQSVKSLRGDSSMTDVIFSGSKSRAAMNVASVTLVFDNSDKYLKLAYDEVSIRRRVYKDGTCEYSINNEKCRLKDITDVLLDTGIAKESFNIISQGKIEEIISSKSTDRRTIFEEAAGVLKYKKRKEDALHKLERTHDNMNRVDDIINELEKRVTPLKEQRDKAIKYEEAHEQLKNIEVALIVRDIDEINEKYKSSKQKIDVLNNEIINLGTNSSTNEVKVEEAKVEVNKLEQEIQHLQQELIEKTKEAEQLNSKKNILLERVKYNEDDSKIHTELINLKEEQLKQQNKLSSISKELQKYANALNDINEKLEVLNNDINSLKNNKSILDQSLTKCIRERQALDSNIDSLKDSIDNSSTLPYAVKSVLNNKSISGILDTIGNVIEVEDLYAKAITTALANATSYVIVENETFAKDAIMYLKRNNIGRVTFFPLNVIKSKYVDHDTINLLSKDNHFINVASTLVKYDPKYKNIVENVLGNIIVTRNIDDANYISKLINNKYRIVTLDGDIIHVGGSLTGGAVSKTRSIITDKYELEHLLIKKENLINKIKEIEDKINKIDYDYQSVEDKIYLLSKDKIELQEKSNLKTLEQKELLDKEKQISLDIQGFENIKENKASTLEDDLLKAYYSALDEINTINNNIDIKVTKKNSLKDDIEQFEYTMKKENSEYNSKNKELKDLEIEVNRLDVKLDNLLNSLNETYTMTYEHARDVYHLDIEVEEARIQVLNLKREIKELGSINMNAKEEYEEVSGRYEFLLGQKEDLTNAENILLNIIEEMDNIMKKEFTSTFKTIQDNFSKTFKELFRGGYAELKLTEPDNILETGVEIVASPPGKKLSSISLLSGGEKTFTAISLLFAILKSRPVPFCILDEVEAALDEVNVDSFGKYLKNLQEKTQFILITHKKRTMEYADVLYGITMQESGVSKLVSVKLEDIEV